MRGDTIVAVGSHGEAAGAVSAAAEIVDLGGNTLLPGLIDSHVHPVEGGRMLRAADAGGKIVSVVGLAAFASEALKTGRGVRGDVLEIVGVPLSAWSHVNELNRRFNEGAFASRAVFLFGLDGHTGWANRTMRQKARLDRAFLAQLSEAERKNYGVDTDGNPQGFVMEAGVGVVRRAIPRPSERDVIENGRVGIQHLHSFGITSWIDAGARRGILAIYRALAARGHLTGRVAAFVPLNPDSAQLDAEQLQQALALRKEFSGVSGLTVSGVKVFADGVAEHPAQTAAMSTPYLGTGGKRGDLLFAPRQFADVCTRADREKLIVHVHAIGDRAVTEALNGIEAARNANGNSGLPHTITHLQFIHPADFPRFRQLGVVAAFQLLWASAGADTIDLVQPYVVPEIYRWQYPARSLLHAGAIVAGGSDWFVSSPNPFEAMCQAGTRRGPKGVLDSNQRMPREAMLYAYTRNAAMAMNQLGRVGSIEVGKKADLTLVDGDVLTIPAVDLKKVRVVWTMVGGKAIYRAR